MKMLLTYGIYEDEIEPVLAAVRAHRPLEEIEAMPCPCCGAKITLAFSENGGDFSVMCQGEPPHLSPYQEIAEPPPWWRERFTEPKPSTFYWQQSSTFAGNGALGMPASGYDADGSHWSGSMRVEPDEPDYPLWRWILRNSARHKSLISNSDLESLREEYGKLPESDRLDAERNPIQSWTRRFSEAAIIIRPGDVVAEARGNLHMFGLDEVRHEFVMPSEFDGFIRGMAAASGNWLAEHNSGPMLFYCWHDAQAGQLRFSLISAGGAKLPFECPIKLVSYSWDVVASFYELVAPPSPLPVWVMVVP